jgi:hypothetical protein
LADHLGSVKHNGKHDSRITMCNLCRVKIDISVMLTVNSGSDFFMIIGAQGGWLACWWFFSDGFSRIGSG